MGAPDNSSLDDSARTRRKILISVDADQDLRVESVKRISTAARLRRLVERREEPFDEDRGAEEDGLQSAGQADHERDSASSGVKGFELSHL